MAFFLFIILAVLSAANAGALTANYPINAQLPPVARVSQPFRYAFAQSTFSNSDADTKYSLLDAPSWLQVDSSTRVLSGTPQSDDTGSQKFKLEASNGSEKDSMEVTLIVTEDEGPTIHKPLVSQLEAMGPVSYPATLFIHPGRPFSIEFDPETFKNTHPSTIYYGTSPNNAPLPSWIGFDPAALKFSGNTPPFGGSGSQTFTFQLVASDVAGYSAANMTFELTIGPHILVFNETALSFNLTRGDKFSSPNLANLLSMDGSPVAGKELKKIEAELPDWLTLDKDNVSLSGTPPKGAVNENITIAVTDSFQDEAQLMVCLEFMELFLGTVDGCEAAIGEDFEFIFNQTILTDDSVQLDVDLDSELSWLTYFPENKTLYGHVPDDMDPEKFTLHLTANQGSTTDTSDFILDVLKPSDTHENPTDPFTHHASSGSDHKKAGIIAISVVLPVVVLLSLLILFCCWRRRKNSHNIEEGASNTKPAPPRPARPDMSNPQQAQAMAERPSRDDNSEDWTSPVSPASDLPKLELAPSWNVSSFDKQEHQTTFAIPEPVAPPRSPARKSPTRGGFTPLRDTVIEEDKPVATSPSKKQNNRLSYTTSPMRRRTTNRSRREPLKTIQPRAMKRESIQSSKSKRYSKRSSGISSIASGLPVRFSGAGHGAGGFGPPGHGVVHTSWQNPRQSLMSDETSLTNMAPMFPRPPAAARMRHSMASSIPDNHKRMTLRTVEPDDSIVSEADSLEAFVHSRAKHRNSSNPLFSAQISRRNSSAFRALNRNHSTRSRADTVSVSTFGDEYRRSIHDRPPSTAISMSEYGDDNARYSHYQSLQPPGLFPLAEGSVHDASQLSLAQEYRGAISPLPRFWSDNSMASAQQHESRPKFHDENALPQSSSMVSDLDEHLNRKANGNTKLNPHWRMSPLESPRAMKNSSQRGLPIASSGELAFV